MVSKKLIGFLVTNISIATIVSSSYFTYQLYEPMKRVVNNLFHRDVQVEQGFFKDPNGLSVQSYINERGTREVYMLHSPSNTKIPVKQDMYPDTNSMLENILGRTEDLDKDEARQYLRMMNDIQKAMYDRL
jgi:hypothetical protein